MLRQVNLTVAGLILGVISLALTVALALGFLLSIIELVPLVVGTVVVGIFILAGLTLSALGFLRRKRTGWGFLMVISGLGVNGIAIAVTVAFGLTVIIGMSEPSLEEASQRIAAEGLQVQTIGGARPALLVLPSEYEPQTPLPLVFSLHGYAGHHQNSFFGLTSLVNSHNFALVLPNGTRDNKGYRFWNATDLCCGASDSKPDDVAYLTGLVDEAAERVNIGRVFVAGISNGGFMSYRVACESMPRLAGIVVVNGSSFSDPARCESSRPVSILHLHGTADSVVAIQGGSNPFLGTGSHPAAREVVQRWARRAGCDLSRSESLGSLDIDLNSDSDETIVTRYRAGCRDNVIVEYWEMELVPHAPRFAPDVGQRLLAWMFNSSG